MLITTDGIVTRSYPVGDSDRLVHLITPDRGRLPVMVKGGQSRGCRFAAMTQLFTYGNYELYRKSDGDMYWLRGGMVEHSFYELSSDISRVALGAYLCDVASDMTDEGEEAGELLRMLLNSLYAIGQGKHSLAVIKGVFELRAASLAGYMPNMTGCCRCGTGYPNESYFDIMNGRIICADCQSKLNRMGSAILEQSAHEMGERRIICPMTASTLAAVRYALSAPDKKIFSFALKDREEEIAFSRVAESYLLNQLERGFDTLEFYHSVSM